MTTRRATPTRPTAGGQPRFRGGFFGDVVAELRKVVWPSQEEATRLTIMVLVISISIGIALGAIDFAFSNLIQVVL